MAKVTRSIGPRPVSLAQRRSRCSQSLGDVTMLYSSSSGSGERDGINMNFLGPVFTDSVMDTLARAWGESSAMRLLLGGPSGRREVAVVAFRPGIELGGALMLALARRGSSSTNLRTSTQR